MRVYIQTDIEGVAGVTFFENTKDPSIENHVHRQRIRKLLTGEVGAAARAAFDCGAEAVVINDSHSSGYNIIFEELDPRCEIIHGRNCSGPHWMPELDEGFQALVLIGMHAMGGTRGANMPHSKWTVNGGEVYLSEASMACALAGDRGIPAVFASGDQYVTAEVTEKIPAIVAARVKKSLGAYIARCVMPAKAQEMIYAGVTQGLQRRKEIPPYIIPGPLKLNLLDSDTHIPPFKLCLEHDAEGATMEEAFQRATRQFPWNKFDTDLPDGFVYP
ncbi:MAG: M55 family metallopeptidase [Armatimonadota bacterium]